MPNWPMAAMVSPPPAKVKPGQAAIAAESALVPAANGAISKTPTGPFQTTVFISAMTRA